MMTRTTGTPNRAVTADRLTSIGAKAVRATRSQTRQKAAPPKRQAGITRPGRADPRADLARKGTAMPTKETGPAKAVTQAASMLARATRATRKEPTRTPTLRAYSSPMR